MNADAYAEVVSQLATRRSMARAGDALRTAALEGDRSPADVLAAHESELPDSAGKVLAEAELAWPEREVAVLHGEEAGRAAFEDAGWRVHSTGEDGLATAVVDDLGGHADDVTKMACHMIG